MIRIVMLLLLVFVTACSTGDQSKELTKDAAQSSGTQYVHASSSGKNSEDSGVYYKQLNKDKELGIVPEKVKIPTIGVNAAVESVGVLENGEMGVPGDPSMVGWYEPGALPGDRGSSVLAGHVDSKTGPAVFYHLDDIEQGDEVVISGKDGERLTFIVRDKEVFPQDDSPVKKIFGYTSRRMLKLITCTGTFDRSQGGHLDRLVVYAELKEKSK